VFGRHVGAIVQGSLLGSMEAEELLFCNTWSLVVVRLRGAKLRFNVL
jgi:hypothetical protein